MTPQQQLEALIQQGFTYYRIAKDTGISPRTLSNWHKGMTKPASNIMIKALNDFHDKHKGIKHETTI